MNDVQEEINLMPDKLKGQLSDGYHTFDELYEHRCVLWICFINEIAKSGDFRILKSKKHHDGTSFDGWFVSCLIDGSDRQLSYHLPMKYWEKIEGQAFEQCPYAFDGHTPKLVLQRLKNLFFP